MRECVLYLWKTQPTNITTTMMCGSHIRCLRYLVLYVLTETMSTVGNRNVPETWEFCAVCTQGAWVDGTTDAILCDSCCLEYLKICNRTCIESVWVFFRLPITVVFFRDFSIFTPVLFEKLKINWGWAKVTLWWKWLGMNFGKNNDIKCPFEVVSFLC